MQLIKQVTNKYLKKVPVFKPGATVRVHQRIKEGEKERVQIFEGLVIAINAGAGPDKTFTVRKIVGGIGVEKVFPLYSKNITQIQVIKSSDVRRAKLYYMRKRAGKSARLKEKYLTEKDIVMEEHGLDEEKPEKSEPEEQQISEEAVQQNDKKENKDEENVKVEKESDDKNEKQEEKEEVKENK